MATYNVIMKQYNGTDYDLLYPIANMANVTGTLGYANGGTNADTLAAAKSNLGIGAAAACSTTTTISSGNTALITSGAVFNMFASATVTSASQILSGKKAYSSNGILLTGTALSTTSNATAAQILKGYTAYNNSGTYITGTAMSTASTATAGDIKSGKIAYTSGAGQITGTWLPYSGSTVAAGQIYSGYQAYNSSGKLVTGTLLNSTITATAAHILSGKTAYSNNGSKITGTLMSTASTAAAGDIRNGKMAYNNYGAEINGTWFPYEDATVNNSNQILSGYKAYGSVGIPYTGSLTLYNNNYIQLYLPYSSSTDKWHSYVDYVLSNLTGSCRLVLHSLSDDNLSNITLYATDAFSFPASGSIQITAYCLTKTSSIFYSLPEFMTIFNAHPNDLATYLINNLHRLHTRTITIEKNSSYYCGYNIQMKASQSATLSCVGYITFES